MPWALAPSGLLALDHSGFGRCTANDGKTLNHFLIIDQILFDTF
jgi:hypothetical protein